MLHDIYTTKMDGVVSPPNISGTVTTRIMKLAHRPRIASTTIKLISKPILLTILLILLKTIQRISAGRAGPKRNTSNIVQINMHMLVLPPTYPWRRSIHDGLVLYDDSRRERNATKRARRRAARNATSSASQDAYMQQTKRT